MPWKIYLDSKKRQPGGTDTDFAIQLPYPINVSGKAFLDVILCPNSFYLVRAGDSDRLYVAETQSNVKRVAFLIPGQYDAHTLATACQNALNQNKGIPGTYVCQYLSALHRMRISITGSTTNNDAMQLWPDDSVAAAMASWTSVSNFAGAVATDLKTATRAMGFMSSGGVLTCSHTQDLTGPHAVNVQPYSQLFIRSNLGGGSSESLGVNGESDICRRIVVGNTPINSMIYDVHSQAHDHVSINGKREFSSLWFQVIDVNGKVVDTHGLPVSFSIIFEDVDEI
jgi:hypothetical protein